MGAIMASNWIVVASRTGARILATPAESQQGLQEVMSFSNEAGRLRNHEIDADRPGAARFGVSSGAFEQHEDAHFRQAKSFASELAAHLEHQRTEHAFDGLVLVAEPRFLGLLNGELSEQTARRVQKTIGKDLTHVQTPDIEAHLGEE